MTLDLELVANYQLASATVKIASVIDSPVPSTFGNVAVASNRASADALLQPQNPVSGNRVIFHGDSGQRYSIQVSSDLSDWDEVGSLECTNGLMEFVDPLGTSLPLRFYRALPAE